MFQNNINCACDRHNKYFCSVSDPLDVSTYAQSLNFEMAGQVILWSLLNLPMSQSVFLCYLYMSCKFVCVCVHGDKNQSCWLHRQRIVFEFIRGVALQMVSYNKMLWGLQKKWILRQTTVFHLGISKSWILLIAF